MAEEQKKSKKGISRRDFIKGTGLAVGGVAISSTVLGAACNKVDTQNGTAPPLTIDPNAGKQPGSNVTQNVTQPDPKTLTVTQVPEGHVVLNVNNRKISMDVQPEWSLAFVLREKLGLTGLKVGCDRGECGACTILVDGKQHLACTMMAVEAEGRKITTIEGLATGSTLHPVQKLFLDNMTFQCGYCTPGMIMTAVELLTKTPNPTVLQVREAISGNLCYCGDYTRIVNTIAKGI